jgi:AraC-like DNA-binding protein
MDNITNKLNIIPIACTIAIFQALLMAIFLFTVKKGNKQSNIILGFWFLCYAVIICCSFIVGIYVWEYFINYHKLIFVIGQLSLLTGPLLYFYAKSLLDENFRFSEDDFLHLLPFIIITSYMIVVLIFTKRFYIWRHPLDIVSNGFFVFQNIFYCFLVLQLLKSHKLSVKKLFFNKKDLKYNWIRFLIIGSFALWIAKFHSFILGITSTSENWCTYTASASFLASFLFMTSIVYLSLKIPDIYLFNKKYRYSPLSKKAKAKFKEKLLKYMNEEKPYLDSTLSLDILAQKLSISTNYLSQVINEMFNQNFYNFVNQYRVKECINRLEDKNNSGKTLLHIAFECGFNTKATFNSAFKKFTGSTPKQFRKNHNLNN